MLIKQAHHPFTFSRSDGPTSICDRQGKVKLLSQMLSDGTLGTYTLYQLISKASSDKTFKACCLGFFSKYSILLYFILDKDNASAGKLFQ